MENFKLNPPTKLDENSGIIGLDGYLKYLEKHYFSIVSLRSYNSDKGHVEMTIDMRCNISLLDMLEFHNKGRWGYNGTAESPLKTSLDFLTKQNTVSLDVEELAIFLNDTCIIIKKIYNRSIQNQLDEIISEIGSHYIYFSKGLKQKPYEIFIPVFEDTIIENGIELPSIFGLNEKTPESYFEFWGVYLESQEDALIYDVNRNTYIPADLDLRMLDDE